MKRLLIITIFLVPFFIYSQGFTIKSALAFSKWTGEGIEIAHENRKSICFGVSYGVQLANNFILNFGGRYLSNGTVQRFSESEEFFDVTYHELLVVKTQNLNIPVLAQYMLNEKVYLLAGPYASFLLSDEVTVTYTECIQGFCTGEKESFDSEDLLESPTIGFELGIGVFFSNKFLFEANYLKGLSSVIDLDDPVKDQSFMLTLGYQL